MTYAPQVEKSHYDGKAYRSPERWASYFHQIEMVRSSLPSSVLEIGVGEGVVASHLRSKGIKVTTLDIAKDLHPDVVGDILALPFPDSSFDISLAAEVLEHLQFTDAPKALAELARVSRNGVVVSLPHPGYVFSFIVKLPLLPRLHFLFQVPFFWKEHRFNGEHYWELGKKGYPVSRFLEMAKEARLSLVRFEKYADDPAHRFFLFERAA